MDDVQVELIDHTGDAGLRISAPSLPRLLIACAEHLVRICCPEGDIEPRSCRTVRIEGHDLVELLVGWLSEINSLMSSEGELYGSFAIDALSLPDEPPCRLEGRAWGETIDPERHHIEREIKAVTFHQAYIRYQEPVWQAQFIMDL
jgi:SHS2 domain-containing protein